MSSKYITIEGLPVQTTVSKLVFHLLEHTKLKKHLIGRINKTPSRVDVEVMGQDQDDLRNLLVSLDGLQIESNKIIAWSKDLVISEKVKQHFNLIEKWQIFEIEYEQKIETSEHFGRFKCIDYSKSIHDSWVLDFNQTKTYRDLQSPPKAGQPLVINAQIDEAYEINAIVLKWQGDFCRLSLDREPNLENWENANWVFAFSSSHIGQERALLQSQRLPYQVNSNLDRLFSWTIENKVNESKTKKLQPNKNNLNAQQKKAYLKCLELPGFQLIQGPPGTGKSKILMECLKTFHLHDKRVLVAASSNAAVDHLLKHSDLPEKDLLRLGHHTRIDGDNLKYSLDSKWKMTESYQLVVKLKKDKQQLKQQLYKAKSVDKKYILKEIRDIEKNIYELLDNGKEDLLLKSPVVFTTHTGFQPFLLKGHKFDVIIVDEAAQCSEADVWLTLPWAHHWILAGDPDQLPALVKSPKAKGFEKSLMQRLIESGFNYHLLEEQYRMHDAIAKFSSESFYGGKLKVGSACQNSSLTFYNHDKLFWANYPQVFIDTAGEDAQEELIDHSYMNTYEATFIKNRVEELLHDGIMPNQIGVISTYSAQTKKIQELINMESLEIENVDAFQGREKDIVFISCVRSNHEGNIGFLSDTRRMNVAMTRAKKLCVIVGDSATLSHHKFYENYLSWKENDAGLHSVWEWT